MYKSDIDENLKHAFSKCVKTVMQKLHRILTCKMKPNISLFRP